MDNIRVDLKNLLGDSLLSSSGAKGEPTSALVSVLEGKHVMLYFSAHWCGPCRNFTPRLAKCFEALNVAGKPVEVVFISLDRNEEDFQAYFGSMPWKAVPLKGSIDIAKSFGVTSIPRLMVLGPDGRILNSDAVQRVVRDPEGSDFPWEGEPSWSKGPNSGVKNVLLVVLLFYVLYRYFMGSKQAENGV